MEKELIIIAKSTKGNGMCVVGIDTNTHEFIRLVATTNVATNEIPYDFMKYKDGTPVCILDCVKINFIKHLPIKYQSENWLIDNTCLPVKVKTYKVEDIYEYLSNDNYIYGNLEPTLNEEEMERQKKSIAIFNVNKLRIYKNEYDKYKGYFSYNEIDYKKFSITDSQFQIKNNRQLNIKKSLIVVTLPAAPYKSFYYKIIAQIIPIN